MYNQLVEQIAADNPELGNYINLFQQMMAQNNNNEEEDFDKLRDLKTRLKKINSIAKLLKEDLDQALYYLEGYAIALGLCKECLGENYHCPVCNGKGQAGYNQLDRELFNHLIMPAIRKASWLEVKEL